MKQFDVRGMSCAACSARVEKAVSAVEGVTSCSVSLLTNSMGVEGTANDKDIITAVQNAGYDADVKSDKGKKSTAESSPFDNSETKHIRNRLLVSLGFLLVLMYFSMGHMMLGFPLPGFMEGNHVMMGLVQMLLTVAVMVINQKFFISGFKGIAHRSPNMDTLVAMGSGASFVYSLYALFAMCHEQYKNGAEAAAKYMDEFYFESAAMILTLITLGKLLESYSKGRTTDALKSLIALAPKTATVLKDGVETEIPVEQLRVTDVFIVKAGDNIPADGYVMEGSGAVDEAALTGESIPVDKTVGDTVSAATINKSGYMKCRCTGVGENTTLSKIIQMVSDAQATKAPIAKIADKVSGIFVPCVMGVALLTFIIWLIAGREFGFALARAISVLVISCPCALGLATPVAIMVGSGVGAKNGILFKTAAALETAGRTNVIALDKTGTVTTGKPTVTGIYPDESSSAHELMEMAVSLESRSGHPLAQAVNAKAKEMNITPVSDITDVEILDGHGLAAMVNGKKTTGGSFKYISKLVKIPDNAVTLFNELSHKGETPLFFCSYNRFLGVISVADVIKPESREAVEQLKNMGIRTVMLTGDNRRTANTVGRKAGVDEVIAEVLPDGKALAVSSLKKYGSVSMTGDGINDAPALTSADTGMAIGAGTDVAIDAADVVLVNSKLTDVPAAIRLSRRVIRNIHENLFWAFIYNIIGIPLAAGVWIPIFGWELDPMFGAAAMSLSSFCVVTNALRLNMVNIHDTSRDKTINTKFKEDESKMEITLKIEGMMCEHCEKTVKQALEAISTVRAAAVDHKTGTAIAMLAEKTDGELLKKAVEEKGYNVISYS